MHRLFILRHDIAVRSSYMRDKKKAQKVRISNVTDFIVDLKSEVLKLGIGDSSYFIKGFESSVFGLGPSDDEDIEEGEEIGRPEVRLALEQQLPPQELN